MYRVEIFNPGFIENHASLQNSITHFWYSFERLNVDDLTRITQSEEFDPELFLYIFDGERMVGLTNVRKVQYDHFPEHFEVVLPVVADGYEDAGPVLINAIIETLRKKGIKQVFTRTIADWVNHEKWANEFGFEFIENWHTWAVHNISDLKIPKPVADVNIVEFNPKNENDYKGVLRIFIEEFKMPEEEAKANIEALSNFIEGHEQYISHCLIYDQEEIVGRGFVYRNSHFKELAYLGDIFTKEGTSQTLNDAIFTYLVGRCREKKIKRIHKPLFSDTYQRKVYETWGFSFDKHTKRFKLDLWRD